MIKGFYDADCGFCTQSVEFWGRLLPIGFVWRPYGFDEELLARAKISLDDRKSAVVAIDDDGCVVGRGPEVFWMVLERQSRIPILRPFTSLLGRWLRGPKPLWFSWRVYRLVASNRMKLSGGGGASCGLE